MAKFVLAYHGGGGMPETEEEQAQLMQEWQGWFASLGDAVIDGGNPFSHASTISPDGTVIAGGPENALTGYSVIAAADMDDAVAKAKGCPVLNSGGTVEVAAAIDM